MVRSKVNRFPNAWNDHRRMNVPMGARMIPRMKKGVMPCRVRVVVATRLGQGQGEEEEKREIASKKVHIQATI